MNILKFFIVTFLCLNVGSAFSQSNAFRQYGVSNGLPRAGMNSICQDSWGYIWIGGNTGSLANFDGFQFNSSVGNGIMPNADISCLYPLNNKIIIGTNKGLFSRSRNGEIKSVKGTENMHILKVCSGSDDICIAITENQGYGLIKLTENRIIHWNNSMNKKSLVLFDVVYDSIRTRFWLASQMGLLEVACKSNNVETRSIGNSVWGGSQINALCVNKNTLYLGSWGQGIYLLDLSSGNVLTKAHYQLGPNQFDNLILRLNYYSDELLIGSLGNGVWSLKNGKLNKISRSANIEFVNAVNKDFWNRYWVLNAEQELFLIDVNGNANKVFAEQGKILQWYQSSDGSIWLLTERNGIVQIPSPGISFYPYSTSFSDLYSNPVQYHNTRFTIGSGKQIWTINKDLIDVKSYNQDWTGNSKEYWIAKGQGLFKIKENEFSQIEFQDRFITAVDASSEIVVLASVNGLYSLKREGWKNLISIPNSKANFIRGLAYIDTWGIAVTSGSVFYRIGESKAVKDSTSITFTGGILKHKGKIWAGSAGQGLWEFSSLSSKPVNIIKAEALQNADINAIDIDTVGNLWLGTGNGIFGFMPNEGKWKPFLHLNKADGLSSDLIAVNALKVGNSQVLAGTPIGLVKLDLDLIGSRSLSKHETRIKSISLLGSDKENSIIWIDGDSNKLIHHLSWKENYLKFDFTAISFLAPNKVKFRYRLVGANKSWIIAENERSATFADLGPGKYTFEVAAMNHIGVWDSSPATISFVIDPPFWFTWWFIALVITSIVGGLYLFYYWRIKEIRQTASLKQKVAQSEQQALRAQMNPHFIFNALNSIQYFILEKDHQSASKHLTKFSKLMRRVLDDSRRQTIILKEEIQTLELYLALESLRFEGRFHYEIIIDDSVDDAHTEIPTMLLQPYLENAIWHGFKFKKDQANLIIEFSMDTDHLLLCKITDNGIGRKKAQELKLEHPSDHKSAGMKITQERLSTVSRLKGKEGKVEIFDLEDSEGNPLGTLVNLSIPV